MTAAMTTAVPIETRRTRCTSARRTARLLAHPMPPGTSPGITNTGHPPGQVPATDRDGDGHHAHREDGPPHEIRGRPAGAGRRERADPARDLRHEDGRHQHQHDGGAGRRARFPGPRPGHAGHGESEQDVAGQREPGRRPGQRQPPQGRRQHHQRAGGERGQQRHGADRRAPDGPGRRHVDDQAGRLVEGERRGRGEQREADREQRGGGRERGTEAAHHGRHAGDRSTTAGHAPARSTGPAITR